MGDEHQRTMLLANLSHVLEQQDYTLRVGGAG